MSTYAPVDEDWHSAILYECTCDPAWKDRGLVDNRCTLHSIIDAVEDLREFGWTVTPPVDAALGIEQETP